MTKFDKFSPKIIQGTMFDNFMVHIGKAQLQVISLISSQMMRMMAMIVKDEEVHICPTNFTGDV